MKKPEQGQEYSQLFFCIRITKYHVYDVDLHPLSFATTIFHETIISKGLRTFFALSKTCVAAIRLTQLYVKCFWFLFCRILRVLCRNLTLSSEFDYERIAKNTPGYVGADLTALTREAAMLAVSR